MSGDAPHALRVVLDTNVTVSGLLSHQGAAHALMDLAVHHREVYDLAPPKTIVMNSSPPSVSHG